MAGPGAGPRHRSSGPRPARVGLFGLLGSGNLGNDGSLEAVLGYLRDRHPDARVDFMCAGPECVTARYGLPATRLHWSRSEYQTASGPVSIARKAIAKIVDAVRTVAWVRRHDVVIVPGMGVLEATQPLRPWGFPYSLFLLCAAARITGTRAGLVSVGADPIDEPLIRWLTRWSARLASYRSYRDRHSLEAMRSMGADTSADEVYPDLAFALPNPPNPDSRTGIVGVGVMAYRGRNAERGRADEVYAAYLETITTFVRWLVDSGRRVRLFTGDRSDEAVVTDIIADLRSWRPGLDPSCVVAEPLADLPDLMRQMATVDAVVATRYHNVLCALKLSKPTVSLGYAAKHDRLMQSMGLGEFCLTVGPTDGDRLIERFTALESRTGELRRTMSERNRANRRRLQEQFDVLSDTLIEAPGSAPAAAGSDRARSLSTRIEAQQ